MDGGVGIGTPSAARGGGPGGQGNGADPEIIGGAGKATGAGSGAGTGVGSRAKTAAGDPSLSSNNVTQYSVTADGCASAVVDGDAVDDVSALGVVGAPSWLQDATTNPASERTTSGAMNLGDLDDIYLLLINVRVFRSVPTLILSQEMSHVHDAS